MHSTSTFRRSLLVAGAALGALMAGPQAWAADAAVAAGGPASTTTTEGVEVSPVIIQLEKAPASAAAPTKASLDETQPESIVTRGFIDQATPEDGGWTTVATIAPSVAGISSNGGGIGNYNVLTLRGLQDGQFNLTFDGIAFGDTNNPTHHASDYFPASTLGAVVVDRGPGAAGDLGQANYGGAIHFFTPDVAQTFGITQKLTYGSFDTAEAVTTINTGAISWLDGGRLLFNFDERRSNGELTNSGGDLFNQMVKFVLPVSDKLSVTAFYTHEWTRFNFEDSSGPGETWAQTQTFGKNFSMNNDPNSEHYTGYNYEKKQSDFAYIDVKYQVTPTIALDNDMYEYFYSNKTISANDLTGYTGPDQNGTPAAGSVAAVANTSPPNVTKAPQSASDIGGYNKLNDYHVYGDILRLSKDWSFGTLKIGGLVEGSQTQRHNEFIDLTLDGLPDLKFSPVGPGTKYPLLTSPTNDKLLENSDWFQGQIFVDFNWRPVEGLTISPGFKYVNFTRDLNAAHENITVSGESGGTKNQPIVASNNYTSPLYFLTVNYKIKPFWSVYGQAATSFLVPALSNLYAPGVTLQGLKPETTTTYQVGTVYTRGAITADLDTYLIKAANTNNPCTIIDPTTQAPTAAYCNYGDAQYSGVEGEASYHFNFGLTAFANGSLNTAKQLANAKNSAAGIAGNPAQELPSSPKWTLAGGLLYAHGPWKATLTYKQVGDQVTYNGAVRFNLPSYDTVNASLGYDFTRRLGIKLQGFNLLDHRTITSFVPEAGATTLYNATPGSDGVYTYQAGRELSVTLIGKF
jgi:iron complex outermembrane receptor protein